MEIPIIIICFNNHLYVENTIKQLININSNYKKDIIIMDNNSDDDDTIYYLKENEHLYKIIHNNINKGPFISKTQNIELYNKMPDKFIITDPDLEFNENLPHNFIEIMSNLSDVYKCYKIGVALKIDDYQKMFNDNYRDKHKIYEWEKQFWENKIKNKQYELYNASVDTTFCLINKKGIDKFLFNVGLNFEQIPSNIRIAGDFTCIHLPWYIKNKYLNIYETYKMYNNNYGISSFSNIIMNNINNNYLKINKNSSFLFIEKENKNIDFWANHYGEWNKDIFIILDKLLNKEKDFIDIGAGIGEFSIYASRKSRNVYSFETGNNFNHLLFNCEKNSRNLKCVSKTSIELFVILTDYLNVKFENVSLINVNLDGHEEDILEYTYEICNKNKIKLLVLFNYDNWKDKNLDRFKFLNEEHKKKLLKKIVLYYFKYL